MKKKSTLHRRDYPLDENTEFDCAVSASRQVIASLKIAERAANEAIAHGAEFVRFRYTNIPDMDDNPEGKIGQVLTTGYRHIAGCPAASLPDSQP